MSYSGAVSPLKVEPREVELPTFNFTGADVVAEMRRLAAQFPEQMAECKYVDSDDRPCCIVGRALANLGVPLTILKANESTSADTVMNRLRIDATRRETAWARLAQGQQDCGVNWVKSIKYADDYAPMPEVAP
ncbi:hypothetical protein [Mycobacteroides chelonae]|jgi:hypothetical protein|uniref:hypothetical protein n=1 Tax=Mycobacteroides chelonae TaxID=1774 RepID=UPI0008A90394|nr:hypothetical protein [Mycobacteroides chelonae]MEC4834397.1 hypothetical protein [Mycobacteroides chelonae]MEC4856683.1 hypothetical protein [Mycobacteroides chelonae]MEC4873105.1 hypothetical protein [Mycobacteroides chelonae]MEC4901618.1 hypothetical protein [Mycobacteroides chelonae]OHT50331.1 hypothetical protein BKG63_20265 [Mycobacteroides chelonae]